MDDPSRSNAAAGLVRLARSRAGLTQRQLAERAGVPQSAIARIESGARQPTIPTLERILAGAGVEVRYRLNALDDHDRVLAAENANRSPTEREAVEFSFVEALGASGIAEGVVAPSWRRSAGAVSGSTDLPHTGSTANYGWSLVVV